MVKKLIMGGVIVYGNLKLVSCSIIYWDFVRRLRNENQGFINSVKISVYQQLLYMLKNCDYYNICLCGITPVGFIGNINNDLRFSVHKSFRKKGIGKFMLNNYHIDNNAIGKVKINNTDSRKLFESCGWKISSTSKDYIYYKNVC